MYYGRHRHCQYRVHCWTCLTDPAWRRRVGMPDVCPDGFTRSDPPEIQRCQCDWTEPTGRTVWRRSCAASTYGLAGMQYLYEEVACTECGRVMERRCQPLQYRPAK